MLRWLSSFFSSLPTEPIGYEEIPSSSATITSALSSSPPANDEIKSSPTSETEMDELKKQQHKLLTIITAFRDRSKELQEKMSATLSISELKNLADEKSDNAESTHTSIFRNVNSRIDAELHDTVEHLTNEYEDLLKLRESVNTEQSHLELCDRAAKIGMKLNSFITRVIGLVANEQNRKEFLAEGFQEGPIKILELIVQENITLRIASLARFILALLQKQSVNTEKLTDQELQAHINPEIFKLNTFISKMVVTLEIFYKAVQNLPYDRPATSPRKISFLNPPQTERVADAALSTAAMAAHQENDPPRLGH